MLKPSVKTLGYIYYKQLLMLPITFQPIKHTDQMKEKILLFLSDYNLISLFELQTKKV